MAETLLTPPTMVFTSGVPCSSPRTAFVPDQVVTPLSYSSSLASPSSPFSPLQWSNLSPRLTSPPSGDHYSTPRPCSDASNGPPLPFPVGTLPSTSIPLDPLPANRLRGSSSTAAGSNITVHKETMLPFGYVWPVEKRSSLQYDEFSDVEIPTIDFTCLQTGDEAGRKKVVAQVKAACLDWGFFHAVNHGIPLELLDRVQIQGQRLFALPKEEKLKIRKKPGGHIGYGHAVVMPTDIQPWSEGFYLAKDSPVEEFEQVLWPEDDDNDFGKSYREYNEKLEQLATKLMSVIVEGLEVNAAHFKRFVDKASGFLRWNHYPPCPQPHKTMGMDAHTDYNLITVLHQGNVGGLQVQKDGNWIAVEHRRDALAINIGDMLQALTNDLYKSIPHRAVVNRTHSRLSMAYFYAPPMGTEISPFPELFHRNNQSCNYKPFTVAEYLAAKKEKLINTLDRFRIH